MSPRYLVVEVLSGVLCAALALRWLGGAVEPELPLLLQPMLEFVFVGGLIIATFVDLEWMLIPDEVSLTGTALGLSLATLRPWPHISDVAMGAGLGFLIVQVPFVWLYQHVTGRWGMGEGDSKLLMMIGAWLGWKGVLFSLAGGAFHGLLAAIILLILGKRPNKNEGSVAHMKLPFGPFLAISALEFLFFSEWILEHYQALITP